MQGSSRVAEILKTAGLVFGSLLFVLVIIEIFIRVTEPREIMRYFYVTDDPVLHHRFVPNSVGRYKTTEFDIDYDINSLGLRDKEYQVQKPAGTYRILMLGDSFIEGDGVYSHETAAKRLEAMLNTRAPSVKWEVINAGVGSYSPLLEYLYLKNHGLQLQPDLVTLSFDLSDVYDDIQYTKLARFDEAGLPIGVSPEPPENSNGFKGVMVAIKDFFKHNTRLYNFIRLRITRQLEALQHEGDFSGNVRHDKYGMLRENYKPADDRDWDLSYKYILLIRDLLNERNIDFWMTLHPYGLQVHPREWLAGREYWGFQPDTVYSTRPQELMEQFCRRNQIAVINMCNDFKALSSKVFPLYLDYNGHWVAEGHEVVAQVLFRHLGPTISKQQNQRKAFSGRGNAGQ